MDTKLHAYAKAEWKRYNPASMDISNWARETAVRFCRLTDQVGFVETWNRLIQFVEKSVKEDSLSLGTSQEFQTVILALTEGEEEGARGVRAEIHRILFREHVRWWDAFESEAAEDMEEGSPAASERFARHCAKILSRRLDIQEEVCMQIVEKWLGQTA